MQFKLMDSLTAMAKANPEIAKDPAFKAALDATLTNANNLVQGAYQDLVKGNTAEAHAKTATGHATIFPALNSLMENIKIKKAGDDWLRKQDEAAQPKPPIGIRAPEPEAEVVTQDPNVITPPITTDPLPTPNQRRLIPDLKVPAFVKGSLMGISGESPAEQSLRIEIKKAFTPPNGTDGRQVRSIYRPSEAKAKKEIAKLVEQARNELGETPNSAELTLWMKDKAQKLKRMYLDR